MIWFILFLGAANGLHQECEYFSMFHTKWGADLLKYADCQDILDGEIQGMEPTKTKFCECTRHDKMLHIFHGDKMNCHLYKGSAWEDDTLLMTAKNECRGFRGTGAMSTRDVKIYDVMKNADDASQLLQEDEKGNMPMTVNSKLLTINDMTLAGMIFRDIDLIPGEDMVTGAFLGLSMNTKIPKPDSAPCANNTSGNDTDCTPAPVMDVDLDIVVSFETSANPKSFDMMDIFDRNMHAHVWTTFQTDGKGMMFVDVLPQLQAAIEMGSWGKEGQSLSLILDRKRGHGTIQIDSFESGNGPMLVVQSRRAPTQMPTSMPTEAPTRSPTVAPTYMPTLFPTNPPTRAPTPMPTDPPTRAPTFMPTSAPTTLRPTMVPTSDPTTRDPTVSPTVPEGKCGGLDGDPDICKIVPGCGYDFMQLKCIEKQCIMVDDTDEESHTFGKSILHVDNCGTNKIRGAKQECIDWLKANGIKRVKKNLAACIIQKSEKLEASPCCRDYICQESGNCNETFNPTPEPTAAPDLSKKCSRGRDGCPDAWMACNRALKKRTGRNPQTPERDQCIVDWYKTSPTRAARKDFWKNTMGIGNPYPILSSQANAECCAAFVCSQDPTECIVLPPAKPEFQPKPQVCSTPPDAGDCTNERRKCRNDFLLLGIDPETTGINTDGELLLSDCIQDTVKTGRANDCCKNYVCSVKSSEGGLRGMEICEASVVETSRPTQIPTEAPVETYAGYKEWDENCQTHMTRGDCQLNSCRYRGAKAGCRAHQPNYAFKCEMFGFMCFQFKGCYIPDDVTDLSPGSGFCKGTLDMDSFLNQSG